VILLKVFENPRGFDICAGASTSFSNELKATDNLLDILEALSPAAITLF
jgi:hypothetical protein